MRKLKLIILLFAWQLNVDAQTYFPLPDSNAVWTISTLAQGSIKGIYKYGIFGDTIINGTLYYKVYENSDFNFNLANSFLCAIIRQSNKSIYRYMGNNSESILYDFNLLIGDTAKSVSNSGFINKKKVIGIDSVLINGQYRKRWIFQGEYWIEGVGSTFGLLYPLFQGFDLCLSLVCLSDTGIITYQDFTPSCTNPLPYDCDGVSISTAVSQHLLETNKTIIFPNPITNVATLKTNLKLEDATLRIYNIFGTEVITCMHLFGQEIKIQKGDLANGSYYYTVSQNDSLVSRGKLIME